MPKKLIIGISIAIVALGVAVFAILLIRDRALREPEPAVGEAPIAGDAADAGTSGLPVVKAPETPVQAGPCGDGICSEGETWCKPDCGSVDERFLGSIKGKATSSTLTIAWTTDSPSTGEVRYGSTERYELGTVPSSTPSKKHEVLLKALTPGGNYVVHVKVTEEGGTVREAGPLNFELPGSSR